MNDEIRAIIRWVPAQRGGRQHPPDPAIGYCTVARFEADPNCELGAWSLRIADASALHGAEVIDARIQFLSPEGPKDLLKEGERFELMEGRKVVAKGVVLPLAVRLPERISEFELALLG